MDEGKPKIGKLAIRIYKIYCNTMGITLKPWKELPQKERQTWVKIARASFNIISGHHSETDEGKNLLDAKAGNTSTKQGTGP